MPRSHKQTIWSLLAVANARLARRSALIALAVEDRERTPDGSATVRLRRRTTDPEGTGVPLSLAPDTLASLEAWLAVRGDEPGPLFGSLDRARKGTGRLTGAGLYALVRHLGKQAGLKVWPHGLRHSAITEALDRTGGDVRAVQRFSRHRDLRTLLIYDDRRNDVAGDVARQVAAAA